MSERVRIHRKQADKTESHTANKYDTASIQARDSVPSSVYDVLNTSGQSLDATTRQQVEPLFGHDFSKVRIHTDEPAAVAAKEINALAFTVGRHIAFGDNQYMTATSEGQHLIAHELAHSVQQNFAEAPLSGLRLGDVDNAYEKEAHQSTHTVKPNIHTSLIAPAVQRFSENLPYVGPTSQYLSPIAWGMRAFGRPLEKEERDILEPVFGNSVNYFMVRVRVGGIGSIGGAARTLGNIINVATEPVEPKLLIHECAHVWQHQNGIPFGYAVSALIAQGLAEIFTGDWERAYNYERLERYHIPWAYWNAEQQAHWIEDHEKLPPDWVWQSLTPSIPIEEPFE